MENVLCPEGGAALGIHVGTTTFIFGLSNSGMLKGGKMCRDKRLWQVSPSSQMGSPEKPVLSWEIGGSAKREEESPFLPAPI